MEMSSPSGKLRILTWNIGHGGGSRIGAICRHIEEVRPDILGLTEFQDRNEPGLRTGLDRLDYPFVVTSDPPGNHNGLLVASKHPFERFAYQYPTEADRERWLAVHLPDFDLDVVVLHIPGATDNKFKAGYGISGAKRKELFWGHVLDYASVHKRRRAIMMGDFNTGLRIDAEGTMFKLSHYMADLIDTGFIDTWRHLHPDVREYTWYSKHKDKKTGISEDFNGFRLDYIFASPTLERAITDAAIHHEPRRAGVSDHASLAAGINVGAAAGEGIALDDETPAGDVATASVASAPDRDTTAAASGADGVRSQPTYVTAVDAGRHGIRFDLMSGDLSDMACGVNGQDFVQHFQPTYVTAKWSGGVLVEARIWGPRVLKDGSLGARELDHVWRATPATGGIRYSDLPPTVVSKLWRIWRAEQRRRRPPHVKAKAPAAHVPSFRHRPVSQ